MRVLRGRLDDVDADHERTLAIVDRVAETGEPAVRVWRPPRQVAFGRRDRRAEGYERARAAARDRGYPVTEREVGGRAVAFTGETLAVALAEPVTEDHRTGIGDRYERVTGAVRRALADRGVDAERGEPPDSFCPGSHSLRVDGEKVAGFAQRVRTDVALVAGLLVADRDAVAAVLTPVYDALDVPFDPESVASVGEDARPVEDLVPGLVEALAGDRSTSRVTVGRGR